MNNLDHLVIAAANLQQGVDYVTELLGVDIPAGGFHQTMATHNHIMQLGNDCYLELIAIDTQARKPEHPRWFALDQGLMRESLQQQPRLITWVMNCPDLGQLAHVADFDIGIPTPLSRDSLSWEFALPEDGRLLADGLLPYCIQWHSSPHPSRSMANPGCELQSLTLHHNRPAWLQQKLHSINAGHLVKIEALEDNESPYLSALIKTTSGKTVCLSSRPDLVSEVIQG